MVACHTSVGFYKSLVCFLVLKYPPSSFIPSLQISKVRSTISEQRNLILECRVKSASEFDHNGLVIIILRKVYELLESVNVVVIWKEISNDCEVDATCIEECMSFLLVTIKVHWHCWLDLCQHTGHSFIHFNCLRDPPPIPIF